MRFSLFLFFIILHSCLYGQSNTPLLVSGTHQDEQLHQVLTTLATKHPIDFYYQKEWLVGKTVTLNYQAEPIALVLEKILANTNLTFSSFDNFAFIIAKKTDLGREYSADYFTAKYQVEEPNTNDLPIQSSLISIGNAENVANSGKATIKGKVLGKDNEPLIGVLIFVEKLNINTVTDIDGVYEINLPIGKHTLETQSIGYTDYVQNIEIFNDGNLTINMQEEVYELGEIVVAGTASDDNVQSAAIGVARLSPTQIRQLPSFLGEADVIKSLFTLPGVSTVGEGASGFNVRGGNIDQNLVTQDGALVFNSSHVLGFFSIFNADVIKGVALYKGHIPAQYGGRLSSVLDVEVKDADNEQLKIRGGIGIVSSRLTAEIPLIKGSTSLLLGGRISYSDWLIRRAKNLDLKKSSTYFYDLNAKLSHVLKNGSNFALGYYQSYDFFRFSDEFGYDWGNKLVSFDWNQLISDNFSADLELAYGDLNNSFFDPDGFDGFTLQNGLEHLKGRLNFFLTAIDNHQIRFGATAVRYVGSPETLSARGEFSGIQPKTVLKDRGQEAAIYINDEFDLGDKLSFSVGLRYSFYQNIGPKSLTLYANPELLDADEITGTSIFEDGDVITDYAALEPRISMKIGLATDNSIKMSYNRMAQYIHLISNTTASTPIDIWQVSTPYIPPQLANNFSIGYFQNFNNNEWESSLELFYKDIEQLVEYKDLPQLLQNDLLETELLTGEGRAYGAELAIKRNKGRWTGQLAYTFSRSERQVVGTTPETTINNGDWFPSNFDSPHNLNLVFKYQVNRRHLFSANFTYRKGRPITAPVAAYAIGTVEVPHFSPRNLFRIPDYHRLDLAYTFNRNAVRNNRFKGSLTVSMYNIYFRKNAFSIFFRRSAGSPANAFRLAVLGTAFPSVTYNFEF